MAISKPDLSGQPRQWRQILATGAAELPFRVYFDEVAARGALRTEGEGEMPSAVDLELLLRARIAEPVEGWDTFLRRTSWGEDAPLIEEWFAEGDGRHAATDLVVEEPGPARLDRALGWVRSLAVATKLIPA